MPFKFLEEFFHSVKKFRRNENSNEYNERDERKKSNIRVKLTGSKHHQFRKADDSRTSRSLMITGRKNDILLCVTTTTGRRGLEKFRRGMHHVRNMPVIVNHDALDAANNDLSSCTHLPPPLSLLLLLLDNEIFFQIRVITHRSYLTLIQMKIHRCLESRF